MRDHSLITVGNAQPSLNLLDPDLSVSLAVALGPFILLPAFHLEYYDLVIFAMANDRSLNAGVADLCVFSGTGYQSLHVNLVACFCVQSRDAYSLPLRHRVLFAAGLYDCVTHYGHSPQALSAEDPLNGRKDEIIWKKSLNVNPDCLQRSNPTL